MFVYMKSTEKFGLGTLLWSTICKNCISLTTPDAVYISFCEATSQLKGIWTYITDLGFEIYHSTSFLCDNIV